MENLAIGKPGPVAQMPADGLSAEVLQKALLSGVFQKGGVPDEAMGLHDLRWQPLGAAPAQTCQWRSIPAETSSTAAGRAT